VWPVDLLAFGEAWSSEGVGEVELGMLAAEFSVGRTLEFW